MSSDNWFKFIDEMQQQIDRDILKEMKERF
jgi:hypothetical protein